MEEPLLFEQHRLDGKAGSGVVVEVAKERAILRWSNILLTSLVISRILKSNDEKL